MSKTLSRKAVAAPNLPTREELLLPVLTAISDGEPHKIEDICNIVAGQLNISPQQMEQRYNGGRKQKVFAHRVRWARQLLVAAGYAATPVIKGQRKGEESPMRGYLKITDKGLKLLSFEIPIDLETLRTLSSEFRAWETQNGKPKAQREREEKLNEFLNRIGAKVIIDVDEDFDGDEGQRVYTVTVRRGHKYFTFTFVQDLDNTIMGKEPTAYDVLLALMAEVHCATSKSSYGQRGVTRLFGNVLPDLIKKLS